MWHSRPVSTPPPFMANAILNFHFDYLNPSLTYTPWVVPSWGWTVSRCERSLQSHVHRLAHWRANSENILWSTPPRIKEELFKIGVPWLAQQKSLSSKIMSGYLCPSKKIEALHHVKLPGSRLEVSSWRPPISTRPLRRRRSRQSRTRTSHCSTWGQD